MSCGQRAITAENGGGALGAPPANEVHVWHACLDVDTGRLEALVDTLDRDELARAGRFRFERDRNRFVAARGLLREVVGRHLGVPAASLRFGYSGRGKPYLLGQSPLEFNVSHSGKHLVVALARHLRLGVDVEASPSPETVQSVAGLVFSEAELLSLRGLDGAARQEQFASFWVRKEAYIKADGRGMALRLEHIDVGTLPGRVLLLDEDSGEWVSAPRWTLRMLEVDFAGAGCVAAEGEGWGLTCSEWLGDR